MPESALKTPPAGTSRLADGGAASRESLGFALVLMVAFAALNAVGFLLVGEACDVRCAVLYSVEVPDVVA